MCLFTQNMKPNIYGNGCKNISNNIMGIWSYAKFKMDAIKIRTHVRNHVRKRMIVQTFWNILFKMISSPFWKLFKRRDTCQFILSPPLQDEASPSSSSWCTSISLDEISPMVVFDEACEDLFKQYPKKGKEIVRWIHEVPRCLHNFPTVSWIHNQWKGCNASSEM